MTTDSVVDSARYRGWSERLSPAWWSVWPIALTGLRLVLRRKVTWFLLALAVLQFLFLFSVIYLKAQVSQENPAIGRFVDQILTSVSGAGKTYHEFMFGQGTVTMIVLALAGEMLVGNDYRQGGLTFYLSRRVGRRHYVIGKLLSIGLLVQMTTALPALVLFAEYGLLCDSLDYFLENYQIALGIVAYGLLMSVALGLVLFASAAWLQRTVPLVMGWACLFALLPLVGDILRRVTDDRQWLLMNFWRDLSVLGLWCFGALDGSKDAPLLPGAIAVVAVVCGLSVLAIVPRVRAVRVVT